MIDSVFAIRFVLVRIVFDQVAASQIALSSAIKVDQLFPTPTFPIGPLVALVLACLLLFDFFPESLARLLVSIFGVCHSD